MMEKRTTFRTTRFVSGIWGEWAASSASFVRQQNLAALGCNVLLVRVPELKWESPWSTCKIKPLSPAFQPLAMIQVNLLLCITNTQLQKELLWRILIERLEYFTCSLQRERQDKDCGGDRLCSSEITSWPTLPCWIQGRRKLGFKSFIEFACPYFRPHLPPHLETSTQAWEKN